MTSDANDPCVRAKDARRGVAIAVLIATMVGLLIWCPIDPKDIRSGLGACRAPRVRDELGFWRQAARHSLHAHLPDCLYAAEQLIAEDVDPQDLGALSAIAQVTLTPADLPAIAATAGPEGPTGGEDQPLPRVGPYPALRLYTFERPTNRPDIDPLDVALRLTGEGRFAAPNFLMVGSQTWKYGPDGIPNPPNPPSSTIAPLELTKGASSLNPAGAVGPLGDVIVVDTGFDSTLASNKKFAPYTSGVTDYSKTGDREGHGTFIATRIRGATKSKPDVRVVTVGDQTKPVSLIPGSSQPTQVIGSWQFAIAVYAGTRAGPADPATPTVLNLSFGSYGCANEPTSVPGSTKEGEPKPAPAPKVVCEIVAVRSALLSLKSDGYIDYVTAAAGNDHSKDPFYPAAFSEDSCFHLAVPANGCTGTTAATTADTWLFAVGSSVEGQRAGYSNYGSFVNIWATGTDVVGVSPASNVVSAAGFYSWSGTSFAAPCVASFLATGYQSLVTARLSTSPSTWLNCP